MPRVSDAPQPFLYCALTIDRGCKSGVFVAILVFAILHTTKLPAGVHLEHETLKPTPWYMLSHMGCFIS